jgi:hypothetical protein
MVGARPRRPVARVQPTAQPERPQTYVAYYSIARDFARSTSWRAITPSDELETSVDPLLERLTGPPPWRSDEYVARHRPVGEVHRPHMTIRSIGAGPILHGVRPHAGPRRCAPASRERSRWKWWCRRTVRSATSGSSSLSHPAWRPRRVTPLAASPPDRPGWRDAPAAMPRRAPRRRAAR